MNQCPREQPVHVFRFGWLRRSFSGEYLFVQRHGRLIGADTEVIAEGAAEALELSDRLPSLSRSEMRAHELASGLLVGRIIFRKAFPQRTRAQYVHVAPVQSSAKLE